MGSGNGIGDRFLNAAVGGLTAGFGSFGDNGLTFDPNGGFEDFAGLKRGFETGEADLKEVTGATAKEEANAEARERFEEEQRASAKQRQDSLALSAANELRKSRSAQTAKGGVNSSSESRGQSRFSNLGGDEQDFLGL